MIGTMSGTSADGIDLAEIVTDGETVERFGPVETAPYGVGTREAVLEAVARGPENRSAWSAIAEAVTRDHATEVTRFITDNTLQPDFVVFHGQTVWHDPDRGETVQLGSSQTLANLLSLPVIGDLRLADMEAGGQGAPIVPAYHRALLHSIGLPDGHTSDDPMCFLNIGGVSNLTFLAGDTILSFDIGPGNALLDDWISARTNASCDENGRWSASGTVDPDIVDQVLQNPFFRLPGPKSLDRNAFSLDAVNRLGTEDGAATLAAITVESIVSSLALLPEKPALWVVCGGGRKNPTLMNGLKQRLETHVVSSDVCGIDGDAVEAQAMAFLGARTCANLPTTYPETTGARRPVAGGRIFLPGR
ncbi:anhydro-N-acetylmuramic acid kinase [Roseibium sp. RKSG952]|uniref:anhydro-N-acetylmuramic acid kinase n=1 Tax=Roseibium sp. RKSG952 TaxID=2529384 RepID=UPI0034CF9DD3